MKTLKARLLLFLVVLILLPVYVEAAIVCGEYEETRNLLAKRNEYLIVSASLYNGNRLEITANTKGQWTALSVYSSGNACIVGMGENILITLRDAPGYVAAPIEVSTGDTVTSLTRRALDRFGPKILPRETRDRKATLFVLFLRTATQAELKMIGIKSGDVDRIYPGEMVDFGVFFSPRIEISPGRRNTS